MARKTCLVALMVLFCALPAFAGQSKYFSGESYILPQNETVDGDLFVFSNTIRIEGTVTGEAFLLGSSVSVPGEVRGDVFVIGDSVSLSGHFVTDARVLGNNVDLAGTFDGEVSVAGRHVDIDATVAGVLNAAGEAVNVAGTFADTANLHARKVLLLPDARFSKDVNVSAEEFTKADSVAIAGKLNTIIGKEFAKEKRKEGVAGWWAVLVFWFVTLCGIVIVGLVAKWLFPDLTDRTAKMVTEEPISNLGWGVLTLILFPIVFGILLITLIGIPLALLLIVFIAVGLYIGKLFVVVATGGLLISRFFKEEAPYWVKLVVGAVVVYMVLAIPIAGFFIAIIVYCLGIGAIVNGFLSSRRKPAAAPAAGKPRPARSPAPRKAGR
jgi:cytoskeletal protein CcmA (bactofilin family)